ncbi:MAG: hypothetical protein A2289_04990 [Deltaproteobacteria bacterium RIFOXYA12_FULL_58_15]|nr:MAG: hypothetical protein A2289_04990 [Deltaproteobacteria bacterium RIFOXYA12_FULL_58_15]OGR09377.1 MAG: hypothetical protein A2341_17970 [Deltaproteobacteria bacterium RIFOXYB12_FULL_58_9]
MVILGCEDTSANEPAAAPKPAEAVTDDTDPDVRARAQGMTLKRYDLNRDTVADVFKFYRVEGDANNPVEIMVRKEMDINHDGKIDIVRSYDDKGSAVDEKTDLDFDGRFDTVAIYKEGVVHHREIDVNYDGKADVTRYYAGGKIERIESDRDHDGRIDTWEYFVEGELDRIGVDADRDGMADTWERKRESVPEIPSESGDAVESPAAAQDEAATGN